MFARFDENPAMTLQDIKKTKRYGRTDAHTHARTHTRTHAQRENSIPTTNKVCGGYNKLAQLQRLARIMKVACSKFRYCSKTCVKWLLSKRPKIGFQAQLSLNAGPKYCRMLQGEHSAILLTFIKIPIVI